MVKEVDDERFAHIKNDPRFRSIPKKEKKVHIDKRFQSMFHDKRFKLHYTMDKRGRPIQHTTSEDLKKYYDVSSSESESEEVSTIEPLKNVGECILKQEVIKEKQAKTGKKSTKKRNKLNISKEKQPDSVIDKKISFTKTVDNSIVEESDSSNGSSASTHDVSNVDLARGEGNVESSSSEEDSTDEDVEGDFNHRWGELDSGVKKAEDISSRLALCNMDWDRIKAKDLFVLFNNFKSPEGLIKCVKVYPSEYGLQRMKEEELRGPIELTQTVLGSDEEDDTETREGFKYHMETLRQYQLNRLRYYYAVVECDSAETANDLYTQLDGMEYESSAAQLDLRFIPDDITFEEPSTSTADSLPDITNYQPALFTTKALQQTMVELTWDETNPDRLRTFERAFTEEGGDPGDDLKTYLASSSSEDEIEAQEEKEVDGSSKVRVQSQISKYKQLLASIEEEKQNKKKGDLEMEITWEPGLKGKTENLIKMKKHKEEMSCFEKYLEKKKLNKKEKRKVRQDEKLLDETNYYHPTLSEEDDLPSDVDLNDPYFKEELESFEGKKSKKKVKKNREPKPVVDEKSKAELELLLMDDDDKNHFNLKDLMEDSKKLSKKKKRKLERLRKDDLKKMKMDNFNIDIEDPRFSALFNSADFNIDPSDTHFRKTKVMENLVQEKQKRRLEVVPKSNVSNATDVPPVNKLDPSLSLLVKSVKNKSQNFRRKK